MPIINLKKYYYPLIKTDTFVEVSDEVANELLALRREEDRIISRIRYHKAYYSLDADNGIENAALNLKSLSPEDMLVQEEEEAHHDLTLKRLEEAMTVLNHIQTRCVHHRFVKKKKYWEIAQAENISQNQATYIVRSAVLKMRQYFESRNWKLWED